MRVLGIDPGTYRMGVGVVDSDRQDLSLVYWGVLGPEGAGPLSIRLRSLYEQLVDVIRTWAPSVVAIEEPFVSRNVRAAMAVGQAQAVAMVAAAQDGLTVHGYPPRVVKRAVTDYGGSSKDQVQGMVRVLLDIPDDSGPSPDAADALAVAICHVNTNQIGLLTSEK